MNADEEITSALVALETVLPKLQEPPAVVILPPDSGQFLIGNQGGFIHLAVASLKAAQGKEQLFKKESWFVVEDLDWSIHGLKPDESAHIYLRRKLSRAERIGQSVIGLSLVLVVGVCLLVGIATIVRWLWHGI
jgi:hypothetical protein